MNESPRIKIGLAQTSPVWLDRDATIDKVCDWTRKAADEGCQVVVFGETFIPGYPFWLEFTDGARFNSDLQKDIHAHYLQEAVQLERDDLAPICDIARAHRMMVIVGCYERPAQRSGHTGYCSAVTIDQDGVIVNCHRKVMPTYEERLSWGIGDGNGLRTFPLQGFQVGALNCWENWLPLLRSALHGQGENLHFAIWPGSARHTQEITRFMALESRSFVASIGSLLHSEDIPDSLPHAELMRQQMPKVLADGGAAIAAPNGSWILEPQANIEQLFTAELDLQDVYRERQNLDISGHYSRPDVVQLKVNRVRQAIVECEDGE